MKLFDAVPPQQFSPLADLRKREAFAGWNGRADSYLILRCRVCLRVDGAGRVLRPGLYLEGADVHTVPNEVGGVQRYGVVPTPDLYYLPISHRSSLPSTMVRIGHVDPSVSPYDWFADKNLLQEGPGLSKMLLTNLVYELRWGQGRVPKEWRSSFSYWFCGDSCVLPTLESLPCGAYYEGVHGEEYSIAGVTKYSLIFEPNCAVRLYPTVEDRYASLRTGLEKLRPSVFLLSGVISNEGVTFPPVYTKGAVWNGLGDNVPKWWETYCLTVTGLLPSPTVDPPTYYRPTSVGQEQSPWPHKALRESRGVK